jgi:hypothetical protein
MTGALSMRMPGNVHADNSTAVAAIRATSRPSTRFRTGITMLFKLLSKGVIACAILVTSAAVGRFVQLLFVFIPPVR